MYVCIGVNSFTILMLPSKRGKDSYIVLSSLRQFYLRCVFVLDLQYIARALLGYFSVLCMLLNDMSGNDNPLFFCEILGFFDMKNSHIGKDQNASGVKAKDHTCFLDERNVYGINPERNSFTGSEESTEYTLLTNVNPNHQSTKNQLVLLTA